MRFRSWEFIIRSKGFELRKKYGIDTVGTFPTVENFIIRYILYPVLITDSIFSIKTFIREELNG